MPFWSSDDMEHFCRTLPKVELHVHLEGTLQPTLVRKIAERNGLLATLPEAKAHFAQYEKYDSLAQFLEVYYQGASVLRVEADYYDMTIDYLKRAAADGVVHIEPFVDVEQHVESGVPLETVIAGITRALKEANEHLGITSGLIPCFQRTRGADSALAMLEQLQPYAANGSVIAIGCDSDYVDDWPTIYAPVYARAQKMGLKLVAHAGEVADGNSSLEHMRQAMDGLGLQRVDHGVRAAEDEALLAEVVKQRMPLTSCPLSNIKLGLFKGWADCSKAYTKLLESGALVTLNSDDPAFFGWIGDNFVGLQRHAKFSKAQMGTFSKNAVEACFAPPGRKAELHQLVDAHVASH